MRLVQNTKRSWTLHFMIYPSTRKGWYTAICLDLALIREGQDFFQLRRQINKIALKYVHWVTKNNLDDALLNQKLPRYYIKKYRRLTERIETERLRKKWQEVFDAIIWQSRGNKQVISSNNSH